MKPGAGAEAAIPFISAGGGLVRSADAERATTEAVSAPKAATGSDGGVPGGGGEGQRPSTGSAGPVAPAAISAIDASMIHVPSLSRAERTAAAPARPVRGSATASPQKHGVDPFHETSPPATAASSPKATRLDELPVRP